MNEPSPEAAAPAPADSWQQGYIAGIEAALSVVERQRDAVDTDEDEDGVSIFGWLALDAARERLQEVRDQAAQPMLF